MFYLGEPLINNTSSMAIYDDESIICTPKKGDWQGGDEVLMVIPKLDRRKGIIISILFIRHSDLF